MGVLEQRIFQHRTQAGKGGKIPGVFRFQCGEKPDSCGSTTPGLQRVGWCTLETEAGMGEIFKTLEGSERRIGTGLPYCGHDFEAPAAESE
jgi:hypothetical protein